MYDLWGYSQSLLGKTALNRGTPNSTPKNRIAQHCAAVSAITEFLL